LEIDKKDRIKKQLKQPLSREKLWKMYQKISKVLNKHKGTGLSGIDVPDASAATDTSGNPDCPKTWKAPWRSVTNPHEKAKVVCKMNANQYHQAHCTPFG
jgi:hypothetical protein